MQLPNELVHGADSEILELKSLFFLMSFQFSWMNWLTKDLQVCQYLNEDDSRNTELRVQQ